LQRGTIDPQSRKHATTIFQAKEHEETRRYTTARFNLGEGDGAIASNYLVA
jgi:hypothetical protein